MKTGVDILADEVKRLEKIIAEKQKEVEYYRDKYELFQKMPHVDYDFDGIVVRQDEKGKYQWVGYPCDKCQWKGKGE